MTKHSITDPYCFNRYVPENVKTFLNDTYYDLMNVVDELQEDLKTQVLEKTEENVNDLQELYNDVLREIGEIDESTNELSMISKFIY